ncbi:hypothetical protein AM493_07940 [Flavobacterium akiainvivens]|uniref:Lipoprotein n=1 Tax=Flavobacterium akiainvivens TaxID=1202724 RepID=A0A0M8MCK4_9FLAO|nr:DUF6146 family protein [Flavobacterium akiainvivens]KOS05974.1 hypothetical protein AM493_07940 [Flavobacterium akiainvivens]SFQ53811.1 hypothetical protein SAMN05444144_10769 [Flavobacterium akiainvivens]
MKNYLLIIVGLCALMFGCKPGETANAEKTVAQGDKLIGPAKNDTVRIANDSLEYEVIIIDPGFNNWLYSRAKPRGYYGQPYMENRNRFWVTEWNNRVINPQQYGDMYQLRIDYDSQIDYGYEVNYLLFNYLVYFQNANNQRLGGVLPRD